MSIASRAFLALLLTVGFYLLAAAIAVGLIAIPFLDVAVTHRVSSARLDLFALVGGALILWSILPRRMRVRGARAASRPQRPAAASPAGRAAAPGAGLGPGGRAVRPALLAAGLGAALAGQGWSVESEPGEPIAIRLGPTTFDVFKVVDDLADGRIDATAWAGWCQETGLGAVPLAGAPAPAVQPVPQPR